MMGIRIVAILVGIVIAFTLGYWLGVRWYVSIPSAVEAVDFEYASHPTTDIRLQRNTAVRCASTPRPLR
jgi:hypothetical protein